MADVMIYIKIHDSENGKIIGMCDSSLINKVLIDGELEINIRDYSEFYKGELVSVEKAAEMLDPKKVYSANIIGRESVDAAIRGQIIHKDGIMKVRDIPYANAFKIKY